MLVAAATLTLAACGSDEGALDWSKADNPVGADSGLVWADARTGEVHLPDGSTLSADRSISSFVVAGKGAFVVDRAKKDLVEVGPKGPRKTGIFVDHAPTSSPDGRYLAFIDTKAGPKDEGGVHQLTSVVVDLKTGKEIFRSTRGMGNPDKDDLGVLYENVTFGVLGMTDTTAWIHTAKADILSIDLGSGKVTSAPADNIQDEKNPWVSRPLTPPTIGGPTNADRSWGIYHVSKMDRQLSTDPAVKFPYDELESSDGTRIVPRVNAKNWYFKQWVDDTTVVGFANTGLDNPDRIKHTMSRSLLTCTVPDGDCTIVPDSENAILPEPSLD
jgi:hypothetical protein